MTTPVRRPSTYWPCYELIRVSVHAICEEGKVEWEEVPRVMI